MDDFAGLLFGFIVCVLPPVVVVGGIFALVRYFSKDRRIDSLEGDVATLHAQNMTLLARLQFVEVEVAKLALPRAERAEPIEESAEIEDTEPVLEPIPEAAAPPVTLPDAGVDDVDEERATVPVLDDDERPTLPAEETLVAPAMESSDVVSAHDVSAHDVSAPTAEVPAVDVETMPEQVAPPADVSAPPPGAGAPPEPASAPTPPGSSTSWEQWIGVRGAAALGASILVLAGVYFFEYSIEHGLITPAMRMVAGTLVGLGCVVASELTLRRRYAILANWIAGAGIGILYLAFWAGHSLYDLYPNWLAGLMLVATTGTCVTLAVRRDSLAIAVLGLCGGFATPLALSTGADRPFSLFGYLLLLDGAMLWVAYRRRWSGLAALCLVATTLYQGAWLFGRLDAPRLLLGVGIVAVFAILFAALPARREEGEDESLIWKLTRSAGVLVPLLFTVPLALRTDLGDNFRTIAAQLVLLCGAAAYVGVRHDSRALPTGAALVGVFTVFGRALTHPLASAEMVWKSVGLALAIGAIFAVVAEVERRLRGVERTHGAIAVVVACLSILGLAGIAAPLAEGAGPWPWLLLWALTSIALARAGTLAGRPEVQVLGAFLTAVGLCLTLVVKVGGTGEPSAAVYLACIALAAAASQAGGLLSFRGAKARAFADHGAALFAVSAIGLIAFVGETFYVPTWAFYAATTGLAVLALLAASRRGASAWLALTALVTATSQTLWVFRRHDGPFDPLELVALGVPVLLFALFGMIAPRRMREEPWTWRTSALVGPLYFLALRHVYVDALGDSTIGLLPLALAAISIGAAYASRARAPEAHAARRVALVWLTAAGAGFVTLAVPLQLSNEWVTLGWALEALALTYLWRRFDHPGLKYLAFALAAAVCVRLMANPYVLGYYPRAELRILNWLSYTYLVPAASLLGMWWILRRDEVTRHRPWEAWLYPKGHPVLANIAASAAIVVVFVFVNLTIFDWFATGAELTIPTERLPARDLTLSISWAVYAIGLLGLGMWRQSTALRVASLLLILLTCGKVFLYDLAHLSDLYRVASLVGLALSLIVISLAYQRFVFRSASSERESS